MNFNLEAAPIFFVSLQQSNMATHGKSEIEAYLGTVHISPQAPKH
jgi:hypothetical protein